MDRECGVEWRTLSALRLGQHEGIFMLGLAGIHLSKG